MSEPIKVFEALNAAEAEIIRGVLADAGVDAIVDQTPSPFDGLTAMGQGTPVFVPDDQLERAKTVLAEHANRGGADA